MLTRDEIIWAYRMILGREPESEDAIQAFNAIPNIEALRRMMMGSQEFIRTPFLLEQREAQCLAARHRFIEANQAFWVAAAAPSATASVVPGEVSGAVSGFRPIFVDLMHANIEYLMRVLVLAKAVAHATGGRLIGMLGAPGVVPRSCHNLNLARNQELATSFGVHEFVHVPDALAPGARTGDVALTLQGFMLCHAEGEKLSEAVAEAFAAVTLPDGFPIGHRAMGTFIRSSLTPYLVAGHTLAKDSLLRCIHETCGFYEWAETLLDSQAATPVFVTGHTDYMPWGQFGEQLLRHGGTFVTFRPETRYLVNVLYAPLQDESLNGAVRRDDGAAFTAFEAAAGHSLDDAAQRFFDLHDRGVGQNWTWYKGPAQDIVAQEFAAYFDASPLPTLCLFTHAYTDQPVADQALFVDRYHWTLRTLEHAADTRAYNLLVKIHPHDGLYDVTGTTERLRAQFASAENIHFLPPGVSDASLAAHCAAGITLRGTPGLFMTARGLPMVCAGKAPYSDAGIGFQPASKEAYFAMLQNPPSRESLGEQTRRAKLFLAFDRLWCAPLTPLLPKFLGVPESEALWNEYRSRLDQANLEDDPLFMGVAEALANKRGRVLHPLFQQRYMGESQKKTVAKTKRAAEKKTAKQGAKVATARQDVISLEAYR